MKKFVKKFLILVLIVSLFLGGITAFDFFVVGSQYSNNYQASLIDKLNRLDSLNEPKIILIGDSNLAFGMDSGKLEQELGMPVVNMGLHGGMGNAFLEHLATVNLRSGDLVVVCHAHFEDNGEMEDKALGWITLDKNPTAAKAFQPSDYAQMLTSYPSVLKKSAVLWLTRQGNRDSGGCYSRNAFNKYGDVVVRPESVKLSAEEIFSKKEIPVPAVNDTCTDRLNALYKTAKERGASMVVAGFPVAYGKYSSYDKSDFAAFREQLGNKLDCEIISDYADYFYPYEYFYDTEYHLTNEGSAVRTAQLVKDLKAWFAKNKSS